MCEQCSAGAIHLGEPVPGFMLIQATKDGGEMKVGQYGLVEENDPFLIFERKPTPEPFHDKTDQQIDSMNKKTIAPLMAWLDSAREFEDLFEVSPKLGWRFVEACRKAGYEDRHGSVAIWFFHKAGEMLAKSE